MAFEVPLVDITPYVAGGSDDDRAEVARQIDEACRTVGFIQITGHGIAPDLRAEADWSLSLGHMVWPHMLARVMLAEQLYRAATILAAGPYHRT